MESISVTRVSVFAFCLVSLFFFSSQTMAAQPAGPAKVKPSGPAVNSVTAADVQEDAGGSDVRQTVKNEILVKALRIPLGSDFKAFFTVEPPPRGIEALREELESKTVYRAVFGINIPL